MMMICRVMICRVMICRAMICRVMISNKNNRIYLLSFIMLIKKASRFYPTGFGIDYFENNFLISLASMFMLLAISSITTKLFSPKIFLPVQLAKALSIPMPKTF